MIRRLTGRFLTKYSKKHRLWRHDIRKYSELKKKGARRQAQTEKAVRQITANGVDFVSVHYTYDDKGFEFIRFKGRLKVQTAWFICKIHLENMSAHFAMFPLDIALKSGD